MTKKLLFTGFLLTGAIAMLIMSIDYLTKDINGIMIHKEVSRFAWYWIVLKTHIVSGILAIGCGPFQFIKRLRKQRPRFHKKLGYLYVLAVGISSIAGFVSAQFAMGGIVSQIGFSILSVFWFYTLTQAMRGILNGDSKKHQYWMSCNYALTFAAITQRTLLLTVFLVNIPFIEIYRLSAWLPWLFNLALLHLYLYKKGLL